MPLTAFLARRERFERVGSTNDVVRDWLAGGTAEVCLAVADEQTAGRGRDGRRWVAPPGSALLLSLGFRPAWLEPADAWRLAAVASLAMAESAEIESGLPAGRVRLKWPNDLVIASPTSDGFRKVAGVLGETEGLGTADPRVVVGLGLNGDWAATDFPADLAPTMTSLRAETGRPVDRGRLLERFVGCLEVRVNALRAGRFDTVGWTVRQATTGRIVRLETPSGGEDVLATGVDADTGALIVADASGAAERRVLVGEVRHVRLEPLQAAV